MKKILCILTISILVLCTAYTGFALPSVSDETSRGESILGIETYTEYPSPPPDDPRVSLTIKVREHGTQKHLPGIIVNILLDEEKSEENAGKVQSRANINVQIPPVTGSDGRYMTDDKGEITVMMFPSDDNWYVVEINEPEYEEYRSPRFRLQENIRLDIKLLAKSQPSSSPSSKPSAQNPGKDSKTGDEANIYLYIVIASIAVAAILILLFYRRRKKKDGGGK